MDGGPAVLSIDVGATTIKCGVSDGTGALHSRGTLPTQRPCSPEGLLTQLDALVAARLPAKIVVGFPGTVDGGRVLSAAQFCGPAGSHDAAVHSTWAGFDLATAASARWHTPTIVVNDAVLHGAAIATGTGIELVITLGTGIGACLWAGRRPVPLDLAFHPFRNGENYTEQLCDAALRRIGPERWGRRVSQAVDVLRRTFAPDRLFLGGGNARLLAADELGPAVRIVDNDAALYGGVAIARAVAGPGPGEMNLDMRLHPEEPPASRWHIETLTALVNRALPSWPSGRPAILAIDGRSSNGKSTLAQCIASAIPGSVVVHTDDIGWHHSMFDWDDLLADGVLEPARRGQLVAYRPPAWNERGRPGSIDVPAGTRLVVVEGVGAGRRSLAPLIDAVLWVQSDREVTLSRDRERMAAGEGSPNLYVGWMEQEPPFQAAERTWERAAAIVAGTTSVSYDPVIHAIVGELPVALGTRH